MSELDSRSRRARRRLPLLVLPLLLTLGIGQTVKNGSGGDSVEAAAGEVVIKGFAFGPAELRVPAGTTVTWTNQDGAIHSIRDSADAFDGSDDLASGDSFEATYDEPGEHPYICGIHDYMRGTVIVS